MNIRAASYDGSMPGFLSRNSVEATINSLSGCSGISSEDIDPWVDNDVSLEFEHYPSQRIDLNGWSRIPTASLTVNANHHIGVSEQISGSLDIVYSTNRSLLTFPNEPTHTQESWHSSRDTGPDAHTNGHETISEDCQTFTRAVYAKPMDWEKRKAEIQDLYMNHNLTLEDVVNVMKSRHKFYATKKMYKSQFLRWNWRKYTPSKQSNGNKSASISGGRTRPKSCLRRRDLRTKTLLHESATSQLKNDALRAFHDLLKSAKMRSDFQPSFTEPSDSYFVSARSLFDGGDTVRAGSYLRLGFSKMESGLRTITVQRVFNLIANTLGRFLPLDQGNLAKIFLSHLVDFTTIIATKHPLRCIASALLRLQSIDAGQLRHFISILYDSYVDWLETHPVIDAGHILDAKLHRLRRQNDIGFGGDVTWRVKDLVFQYDQRISESTHLEGGLDDNVLDDEFNRLMVESELSTYLESFADDAEALRSRIIAKYDPRDVHSVTWSSLHLEIYLEVSEMIISHLIHVGDATTARTEIRKLCRLYRTNRRIRPPPILTYTIQWLRQHGMDEEADALYQIILAGVPQD